MSDEHLRRLERAAMSSPDDLVAFRRWKAELDRVRERIPGGVRKITYRDTQSGIHRIDEEGVLLVDASGGHMTIMLSKAAESYCRLCVIKKVDPSGHIVTVCGADPTELIDGMQGHVIVSQFDTATCACDGEKAWWLV